MANEVKIKAFRATEDKAACQRFLEGHKRVLDGHGVKQVTSSKEDWLDNPSAFVILVESPDETKIYGGARLHCADGIHPLPIEEATCDFDPRIHDVVRHLSQRGTSELCGLWNSREVAGMGIGAFFATMCGVVIAEQLGLTSIFALCSPYSVRFAEKVGCRILTDLGNEGTFYYPKIDLLATIVLLEDTRTLEHADPQVRESILRLRRSPRQKVMERSPLRNLEFEIDYDLALRHVSTREFHLQPTH
jgi:hypothetical protein